MNIKNVYILDDRAILYINGEDAKEFLQNLISNDINKVSDVNSCFSSLLTPQGKFLYEFIIVKHKSGYLLDCEKPQAEELFKQLSLYKLRSKVDILNLSNEFVVAAFSHEKFLKFDDAKDQSGFKIGHALVSVEWGGECSELVQPALQWDLKQVVAGARRPAEGLLGQHLA